MTNLNGRTAHLVATLLARGDERRIQSRLIEGGGLLIDCGNEVRGGLLTGLDLARISTAGLADVCFHPAEVGGKACVEILVSSDHPVVACLASQYAGWQLAKEGFFAMGSGPMRAAAGTEPIFNRLGIQEHAHSVIGVLEGRTTPTPEVIQMIAEACKVAPSAVTLLMAPTSSLAGCVQVVSRSVETALHKLSELDFDLDRIVSAVGSAPLPPMGADDLLAVGLTNDAILYGGRVILYVTGDDDSLQSIGPQVPSSASEDHGEPFASIFARYNHDFYAVDPHLFSPAEITFQNFDTGNTFTFGRVEPEILANSFRLTSTV